MQSIDFLNREIFLRFGNVSRARGPFLYTEKSVRLTDMFQENGRAILGWGGGSAFTFFKNVLSRGQTGSFKTVHKDRLKKAVSCLFNDSFEILILKDKSLAAEVSENIFSQKAFEYRPWLGDFAWAECGSNFGLGKGAGFNERGACLENSAGSGSDFGLGKGAGFNEKGACPESSVGSGSNFGLGKGAGFNERGVCLESSAGSGSDFSFGKGAGFNEKGACLESSAGSGSNFGLGKGAGFNEKGACPESSAGSGSDFSFGKGAGFNEKGACLESSAGSGSNFGLGKDEVLKERGACLESSFNSTGNSHASGNNSASADNSAPFNKNTSADKSASGNSSAPTNKTPTPDTAPFPSTIIFTPPLAWAGQTCILAVKESLFWEKEEALQNVQEELCPPCLLQAWSRSVYDLIKALQERQEKDWFIYDQILTKYFVRKGPYLKSKVPPEKYPAFVKHCLDCHIVINPDCDGLSIVPYSADKGVFGMLKKNPFTF